MKGFILKGFEIRWNNENLFKKNIGKVLIQVKFLILFLDLDDVIKCFFFQFYFVVDVNLIEVGQQQLIIIIVFGDFYLGIEEVFVDWLIVVLKVI